MKFACLECIWYNNDYFPGITLSLHSRVSSTFSGNCYLILVFTYYLFFIIAIITFTFYNPLLPCYPVFIKLNISLLNIIILTFTFNKQLLIHLI